MNYKYLLLHTLVAVFIISRLFFVCTEKGTFCSSFSYTPFNATVTNIGEGSDDLEFMGFMYLTKENILSLNHPFQHTNTLRYPAGFDFSYGFDGVASILLGSVLSIFINLILAYNVTILLMLFANYLVTFYYFKKISNEIFNKGSVLAIFTASVFFSFGAIIFSRASSHLNLLFVAGWPFIFYYLLSVHDSLKHNRKIEQSKIWGIIVGLLLLAFGSLQYLILLTYFIIFSVIYLSFSDRGILSKTFEMSGDLFKKALLPIASFVVLFLMFFYGYVIAIFNGTLNLNYLVNKHIPAGYLDPFFPNQYLNSIWGYINPSTISIEKSISIGVVGVAIVIWSLINSSRRIYILSLTLIWLVLSYAAFSLPFYPEGGRSGLIIVLLISILILNIKNKIFLSVLLTVLITEKLLFSFYTNNIQYDKYEIVRNQAGDVVLNVPLSKYNAQRSITPYLYNKKVFDGYFHYTADNLVENENFAYSGLRSFNCNYERHIQNRKFEAKNIIDIDTELYKNNAKTIVYYKTDKFNNVDSDSCKNVRDTWKIFSSPISYLNDSKLEVETIEFNLSPEFNSNAYIYFANSGEFILTGVITYPNNFTSVSLITNDENYTLNEHKASEAGNIFQLLEPIIIKGEVGEVISISGAETTGIIKFYYTFRTVGEIVSELPTFRSLTLIYSDTDRDVFNIE